MGNEKVKRKLVFGGLLILGLALAGCGDMSVEDGPNISVYGASSPPRVGEKLRAVSSGAEFTGDFIWEYSNKREGGFWGEIRVGSFNYGYPSGTGVVSNENDQEFTIGNWLIGYYLRVSRKTKAADNMQYSGILGRIQQ
jgi:hypothetical protein